MSSRSPTGVVGLDEILGGGFPSRCVILLLGEPGAGKTILCSQFLFNGFTKYGDSCIFVSMDETKDQFFREMRAFCWDFQPDDKDGRFTFINAFPIHAIPEEVRVGRLTMGRQHFSLISLLELLRNNVKKLEAGRIVVDPLSLWLSLYQKETERRRALLVLVQTLVETGRTCLLSSELRHVGLRGRTLQFEEGLSHAWRNPNANNRDRKNNGTNDSSGENERDADRSSTETLPVHKEWYRGLP